jgi:hypothetical protein
VERKKIVQNFSAEISLKAFTGNIQEKGRFDCELLAVLEYYVVKYVIILLHIFVNYEDMCVSFISYFFASDCAEIAVIS